MDLLLKEILFFGRILVTYSEENAFYIRAEASLPLPGHYQAEHWGRA
jgi:hypothetical protein